MSTELEEGKYGKGEVEDYITHVYEKELIQETRKQESSTRTKSYTCAYTRERRVRLIAPLRQVLNEIAVFFGGHRQNHSAKVNQQQT